MYIIPAIDLYNGCAVRLKKGDYEQMTVYSNNPPEFAEKFEKSGAEWLHVVDLEGAKDGTTSNIETVKAIVEKTGMKVTGSEKIIELCRATPEEAALLAVKKGDYLLFVRSTAYDRDGEPVYAGVQVINGDRFALRVYESDGE